MVEYLQYREWPVGQIGSEAERSHRFQFHMIHSWGFSSDFRPTEGPTMCPISALEVSAEQQWSEWWLSWKVRWNWFFSPRYVLAALTWRRVPICFGSIGLFWRCSFPFSPLLSLSLLGFSSTLTGPLALPRLDNVSRWLAVRAQWSDMETTRQALQELA